MWRYYGLRFGVMAISRLPTWLGYLVVSLTGDIAFLLARESRATVEDNLRRVLGRDIDRPALRRVVRRSFRNLAAYYYDVTRLPRCSPKRLNERIDFRGLEHLEAARAHGMGVIIATAHLGSFELVAQAAVAHSLSITVLVERLKPEKLWRYWMGLRTARGVSFEPADARGVRAAFRTLRQGGIVGIAADRAVHGQGVVADFMGEPAVMPTGAIELALRTGAVLLPAFSLRAGRDRYRVCFEPPIPVPARPRYSDQDVQRLLAQLVSVMERFIREAPEQWLAFQPIWTRRPSPASTPPPGQTEGA